MRSRLRVLLVCAASMIAWSGVDMLAAPPVRSYVAGNFILELDGVQVGAINGVKGGLPFSDVIKEPPGEGAVERKSPNGRMSVRPLRRSRSRTSADAPGGSGAALYTARADTMKLGALGPLRN